jgi:cytochrome P450
MGQPLVVKWAFRHGLLRIVLNRAARRGELQALLVTDPAARDNPFPIYERIRAQGALPVGRLTHMAAGHAAASGVLRSDKFRVGLNQEAMPRLLRKVLPPAKGEAIGPLDAPSLLGVNPPDHNRFRRQVAKVFTARAITGLEARVREIADELLDDLADLADNAGRDVVDLVEAYCCLLPVTVIAEILGVPVEMRESFVRWGNEGAPALDMALTFGQYRRSRRALGEMNQFLYEQIDRLRAAPRDNLLSRLIQAGDDSARMTDLELMATANLLLAAGFETTVNLLSSGTHLLLGHPDQLEVLRADPALWANAVDEILRLESPVQGSARFAAEEVEICGVTIPKWAIVMVFIASANRDPAVFPDPDRFDVTRPNARDHLAFSAGVHYCIGAALARAEGRIGLQALFERYPDLTLAGPGVRRSTRMLRGFEHLPVRLTRTRPGERDLAPRGGGVVQA